MPESRQILAPCPALEAVAAYVDGTVDAATRQAMEAHLADCEACYDLVVEMVRTADELAVDERPAARPFVTRRFLFGGIGLLAAAATLVLAVRPGGWLRADRPRGDRAMAALVAAVGPERLIEPRLSGGFEYGPLRSQSRGMPETAGNLALLAAAADAGNAAQSTPAADTLHAAGVAQILIGQYDAGVRILEDACRQAAAEVTCQSDLGAAYLARATATNSAQDLELAATHTRRALDLQPGLREAAFNQAIVLERKDLRTEAAAAWSTYLLLDPDSPWSAEARRHRARLGT